MIYNLGLESNLSKLFLFKLVFPSVFIALFVATDFVIADFHEEFDVVLHDHVQEVAHGLLHRRACRYQKFLFKA